LPFTVTVSVSTGVLPPLTKSVNVIVPVGDEPPERTAESFRLGTVSDPSDTFAGLGVVISVGRQEPLMLTRPPLHPAACRKYPH